MLSVLLFSFLNPLGELNLSKIKSLKHCDAIRIGGHVRRVDWRADGLVPGPVETSHDAEL